MKAIQKLALKAIESAWFYPAALLFIGIIAYGLMLPRLGFYWDDWEGVYLYKLHNAAISFHYYAERPVSAIAYLALFPFIKMTPVVTQALTLLLRWGGVLFIYYTLNKIWPDRTWLNRWVGALLFVFPGFFDQQVSVAFIPHLTTFLLFSCSLFLTALAIRDPGRFWLWMPLSVLLGITQIFMMEYFVVLELLRPLMIWFMLRSQPERRTHAFLKTFLYWLPFLAGLGVYLWWRLAYLPSTLAGDPNNPVLLKKILSSPVEVLLTLASKVYQDIRYLLLYVWTNAIYDPNNTDLHAKMVWVSWLVGILAAILFSLYVTNMFRKQGSISAISFIQPVIFGIVALLAGGIPVWVLDRQISVGKWSDRFALAPMVGAVILIVHGIGWLFRTDKQKQWFLTLLLAFSISAQLWNGNTYRLDWGLQQGIYWQLAWRIPALKAGTAIIGKGTFTEKSSYYDGNYIINLLFDKKPGMIANYAYFDVFHLPPGEDGYQLDKTEQLNLAGQFSGNTSQAIGMYFNLSGGCVRILDKVYQDDPNFTNDLNSDDWLNQLIAISNVDQIMIGSNPGTPERAIFGAEPSHGWCYYFEKADLARQEHDWQTIIKLGSEADAKGLKPVLGAEYIPFIEAHTRIGEWSKAYDLSVAAQKITPSLNASLCNNWSRFALITIGADRDDNLDQAKADFCGTAHEIVGLHIHGHECRKQRCLQITLRYNQSDDRLRQNCR